MAKQLKTTKPAASGELPQKSHIWVHLAGAVALLACLALVFVTARRYVLQKVAFPAKPPTVVLLNRPEWMTDFLARSIAQSIRPRGARSSFDHDLLVEVDHLLQTNPWVRQVRQIRRAYGDAPGDRLEIDCEFRAPAALVKSAGSYWLVDANGVRLPEKYSAVDVPEVVMSADGRRNFRVIEGVKNPPPPAAGEAWAGDDLAAGLELIQFLGYKPFLEDIYGVSVDNFDGRLDNKEAHLVLITQFNTRIRWGRPVGAKDAFIEVSPERKLAYLQKVQQDFGRVDAKQPLGIDIRYDKVTYPASDPKGAHADTRK